MVRIIDIHPENPQERNVNKVVDVLRSGGVVALPTDSGYAIVSALGNRNGLDRIRQIRQVDEKHHFTLLCHDFAQLGSLVIVDNAYFRLIKSLTPGPYTFIMKGTKEVPKVTLNPKKNTIGARIPDNNVAQAVLEVMGEALLSSTLILPGDDEAMTQGWLVHEEVGNALDLIVDADLSHSEPTSVIDLSGKEPVIEREGTGDLSMFVTE